MTPRAACTTRLITRRLHFAYSLTHCPLPHDDWGSDLKKKKLFCLYERLFLERVTVAVFSVDCRFEQNTCNVLTLKNHKALVIPVYHNNTLRIKIQIKLRLSSLALLCSHMIISFTIFKVWSSACLLTVPAVLHSALWLSPFFFPQVCQCCCACKCVWLWACRGEKTEEAEN